MRCHSANTWPWPGTRWCIRGRRRRSSSEGAKQPDVAAFIEECGQAYTGDFLPGTELVDLLLGREGAAAPSRRNVLNEVRNLTVHLGQPQKVNEDQIPTVLAELAAEDETGAVVLGESPRAEFADDVLYLLTPIIHRTGRYGGMGGEELDWQAESGVDVVTIPLWGRSAPVRLAPWAEGPAEASGRRRCELV